MPKKRDNILFHKPHSSSKSHVTILVIFLAVVALVFLYYNYLVPTGAASAYEKCESNSDCPPGYYCGYSIQGPGKYCVPLTECNDGIDNDGDKSVDLTDFGCMQDPNRNDETNCGDHVCEGGETSNSCIYDCPVKPQCNDGTDNDGDEAIDYPSDFSCSSLDDNDETNPKPQCNDGTDNDGDGNVDCADYGCQQEGILCDKNDNDETDSLWRGNCCVNKNSCQMLTESECRSNTANVWLNTNDCRAGLNCPYPVCSDNEDNDGDNAIDYPNDLGCSDKNDISEDLGGSDFITCHDACRNFYSPVRTVKGFMCTGPYPVFPTPQYPPDCSNWNTECGGPVPEGYPYCQQITQNQQIYCYCKLSWPM